MILEGLMGLERQFFRQFNRLIEPAVRAGIGSPVLWPVGLIVVEVKGRKTNRTYNLPLAALRLGELTVVGTVRSRSQWMRNLAAHPEIRYWLAGEARESTAHVIACDIEPPPLGHLSPLARWLASWLAFDSLMTGTRFALLTPRQTHLGKKTLV